jgi:hypothetical protein
LTYDQDSGSVSISAERTLLSTILEEIVQRGGFSIALPDGPFDEQVSVKISESSLEAALRRLLAAFNLAFVYAPSSEGNSQALVKVTILSRRPATSIPAATPAPASGNLSSPAGAPTQFDDGTLVRRLVAGSVDAVRAIVETLRQSGNEQQRERVVEALLDRLRDKSSVIPDGVITAVKDLAPESATDLLLDFLRSADPQLQNRAAAHLWRFDDERVVEPLSRALRAAAPETRRAAATSLALIGSPEALDALLNAYQAKDDGIRYPAWLAIVSHGSPASQARLGTLLAAGHAPPVPPAMKPLPQ